MGGRRTALVRALRRGWRRGWPARRLERRVLARDGRAERRLVLVQAVTVLGLLAAAASCAVPAPSHLVHPAAGIGAGALAAALVATGVLRAWRWALALLVTGATAAVLFASSPLTTADGIRLGAIAAGAGVATAGLVVGHARRRATAWPMPGRLTTPAPEGRTAPRLRG